MQKDSFILSIISFHESEMGGANLVGVERGIVANLNKVFSFQEYQKPEKAVLQVCHVVPPLPPPQTFF